MRLTWYILRLHIGPFLFGTFAVVFLFLLQFIFKALNLLVGKGISYWVIAQFITYNLAWMLVLAVPMGVLVSTLMAYGKLSGNNELTIIKSSGGSALRAMRPAIIGGAVMFGLLFLFNDYVLPETNHRAFVLQQDISNVRPTFAIEPGRFTSIQNYSILARDVDRQKNLLHDVTIYSQESDNLNVINAEEAELRFTKNLDRLLMTFRTGEIQQVNRRDLRELRRISFKRHQVVVPTSGFNFSRTDPTAIGRNDRTMTIDTMLAIAGAAQKVSRRSANRIDSLLRDRTTVQPGLPLTAPRSRKEAATLALSEFQQYRSILEAESMTLAEQDQQADSYLVEVHKKYAIPAACLVFVLVGAPLGTVVRRGNFGVSATIALGFFIVYWSFLVAGEKLADRGALSPGLSMWLADIVLGVVGLYLTILVSRETIGFGRLLAGVRRLFGRRATPGDAGLAADTVDTERLEERGESDRPTND